MKSNKMGSAWKDPVAEQYREKKPERIPDITRLAREFWEPMRAARGLRRAKARRSVKVTKNSLQGMAYTLSATPSISWQGKAWKDRPTSDGGPRRADMVISDFVDDADQADSIF